MYSGGSIPHYVFDAGPLVECFTLNIFGICKLGPRWPLYWSGVFLCDLKGTKHQFDWLDCTHEWIINGANVSPACVYAFKEQSVLVLVSELLTS